MTEAEPLMRRALEVFIQSLGTEHPNSRTVAGNYIGLLQAMGRTEDDIKRLCKRQASEISDNRWEFDTQQLVKGLEKAGRAAPD